MGPDLKQKRAFILIELITTIVLIGIVVIPSSIFLIESIRAAFRSQDTIVAVNLARMEIEKTNNMAYDYDPDKEYLAIGTETFPDYEGYNYDLSRSIQYIEGGDGTDESVKEIKVEVYPAGKLGSTEDLLTRAITHRAKNVEYE